MSKDHIFYHKNNDGSWMVYCRKTTGSFSTKIWDKKESLYGKCPCCMKDIK